MSKSLSAFVLITAVLSFTNYHLFAQRSSDNYELQLKSGNVSVQENISDLIHLKNWIDPDHLYNGKYYALLMFNRIPDQKMQSKLKSLGVSLQEYLPNFTYMAVIDPAIDLSELQKSDVRSLIDWKNDFKLAPSILGDEYPRHALRPGNRIELNAGFYRNLHSSVVINDLQKKYDIEVIQISESTKKLAISILTKDLRSFASEPYVTYAEPVDPPSEPENYTARTLTRSNAIANDYSTGRKYDGTGVTVMLQDDGLVGPHIDYQGRVNNSSTTSNSGDHGDHIAGTIMGAGNLDPTTRGFAFAADLVVYNVYAGISDIANAVNNRSVVVTSTSYSNGCNAGYTSFAQEHDQNIIDYPSLMHVFSAGNSQGSDCGYGAGSQWGNITGGHKVGKNVIAVAALDLNGGLASFSSVGPAHDGRIKPDVGAKGSSVYSTTNPNLYTTKSGTSMSCPNVSGSLAQLYSAYKQLNAGANPPSALMKATIMNTADDKGVAGPDYKFGYGLVNNLRAVKVLESGNYFSASIAQGGTNLHNITVPAGVQQIRVMVYWPDVPAAVNANPALVNDLNMTLTDPSTTVWQPWVLNPTPNATTLNNPATRGLDNLNNVEQVTLDVPAAGTYTLSVNGFVIPLGTQTYYVVYSFVENEIEVTYPVGGESLVPGATELIRWDAFGTSGTFTVEYSDDNGATWNTISSTVAGTLRQLSWVVPSAGNIPTGRMLLRVSRAALSDISDANFSVIGVPTGLTIDWICVDSISISWNPVTGATGYIAYVLGSNYMDSVGTTTATNIIIGGLNPTVEDWISVSAIGAENAKGRRALAINKPANSISCPLPIDAGVSLFVSPVSGTLSDCQDLSALQVTIEVKNFGIDPLSNIPVTYSLDGGAGVNGVITGPLGIGASTNFTFAGTIDLSTIGTHNLIAFTSMAGDGNNFNDTVAITVETIAGTVSSLPYSENFETFPLCGTLGDCEVTICNMVNGWINKTNGSDDDIDWRTDDGGTPSTGTGPSVDHNPGTSAGNYLYLETSGTCSSRTGELISPCFDLTSTIAPQLTFWYHMFGTTMGSLHVDILSGGSWINDVVPALSGDMGDVWRQQNIDLTPYAGLEINVRFRGISGSSFTSDIAIDDITVFEVSAPPVTNFVSDKSNVCLNGTAQLSDLSSNIPNSWLWSVSPGTYNFVGGTSAATQHPIIQFTALGTYNITLISGNMIGYDTLTITGIVTAGNGNALPVTQDFETGVFPPAGGWWIDNPDFSFAWDQIAGVTGSDGNSTIAAFVDNYVYNAPASEDALNTLILDLSGTTSPLLTFDVAYAPYSTTLFETLRIDVSSDCGDSFSPTAYSKTGTTLATVPAVTSRWFPTSAAQWRNDSLDLTPYAGNTIVLRFVNINGYGNSLLIDNINIEQPVCVAPVLSATVTNILCNGNSDGTIDLTVSGGTAPLNYVWSGGETTEDISGKPAGTYTVSVTDAEGCTSSTTVQITQPAPISATTSKSNVTCNGADNGTAKAVASGGTIPFTYVWNTNPIQSTDQVIGLPGGTYTCGISDANGCTKSVNVTIVDPSPLLVFSIPNNPNPGDINLLVSGGIAPFAYNWNTGATTEDIFGQAPGFYFCQVADRNGCAKIHALVLMTPPNKPTAGLVNSKYSEVPELFDISIFPNPASENTTLKIEVGGAEPALIEVYNIEGKQVFVLNVTLSKGSNALQISTGKLSAGFYQLNVTIGNSVRSEQLIIE